MSKSIHQTVKGVVAANSKRQLTPDNPDLIALAQKRRYKLSEARKRAEDSQVGTTGVKGNARPPRVK